LQFDLRALFGSPSALLRLPVFLAGLLIVRGAPALIYRGTIGLRRSIAAGLLQATSLPFIVAATAIGVGLGLMRPATAAALVGAGLLSVVGFPPLALALLRQMQSSGSTAPVLQSAQTVSGGGIDG